MKTFREFAGDKDTDAIKFLMFKVLDPQQNTLDPDSKSVFSRPLSDFKHREKLLTDPALSVIINKRKNRGAIAVSVKSDGTTIGNLLAMLTAPDTDPEFSG